MSKFALGVDVGISSVGWGIINQEDGEIIDVGVRIFSEGTSALNADRRAFRSSRRLKRRRQHRIFRIKQLLKQNNIINDNFIPLDNPYEIRVKGLKHKLSNEELATAILHIAKRRGLYGIEIIEEDEKKAKDSQLTKEILKQNQFLLKDKYICEIQFERLKAHGKLRGEENRFTTNDYIKELEKIFTNQTSIDIKTKNRIIDIIERRREYYEGPGSQKSPTPYGRFTEKGQLVATDLIEKMRGKCTIYPSEKRAPKMSYTANMFNFLNDLNNLSIGGESISKNDKITINDQYINEKGNITPNQLAKFFNVNIEQIQGFRIDKKGEPKLTEFSGYKKIKNIVEKHKLNSDIYKNKEFIDRIIEILTSKKGIAERKKSLKLINKNIFNNKVVDILANISGISGYHSLSFKAMKEIEKELLETNFNQMEVFQMNGYFNNDTINYKGRENIPFNNELVLSAVAKRAQQETLKIINTIRKKYGELDTIVIEMARDKNSQEEKLRLREEQAKGEKIRKSINELLHGKDVSYNTKQKIRLYKEQDGKCLYTGKPIDLNLLINDPYQYEIDHIIPLSISFDDSAQNKVIVCRKANQIKGQRTPYEYFKLGAEKNWTYEDYKNYILKLSISRKKKALLLYEKDINSYEAQKEFINRNLIDTRYASKGILNTLMQYFKVNNIPTKVHTIRGAITSTFRKKAQIDKNRDEDYRHHAIDALIIAGIKKMKYMDQILNFSMKMDKINKSDYVYDKKTGEIITLENEKEFFDKQFIKFINNLRNINVRYSHKIDSKPNRSISDQTIYGVRQYNGEDYVIKKYKNIYDSDGEKLADLFRKNKANEKLLMYKYNIETYKLLEQIVKQYKNSKNPFLKYKEENGDYIRKVSKKDKGPIIKSVKYIDGKLGSHLDISQNYQNGKGGKVVLLQVNPYRIDIYQEQDGTYKFLKINHHNLKRKNGKFFINSEEYIREKNERKISKNATLQFILYKNDLFYYETFDGEKNIVRYNGTMYQTNTIEYKLLNCQTTKQLYLTIGKKIKKLQKINSNILGVDPKKILAQKELVMI